MNKTLRIWRKKKEKNDNLNIDSLLEKFEVENISTLLKELKKNEIKYNKENEPTINFLEKTVDYTKLIMDDSENFNKDNENQLISLLQSNIYFPRAFLIYINNYRKNGFTELSKKAITIISNLLIFILDFAIKNNNSIVIKLAFDLSLIYYHLENDQIKQKNKNIDDEKNNKIYIINYLKKSKLILEKEFWFLYLEGLINDEFVKLGKRKGVIINEKQKNLTKYSCIFI